MTAITNSASTGRINEYKGTVAVDHQSHPGSLRSYIEGLVDGEINEGYYFAGLEMRFSIQTTQTEDHNIDVILGRDMDGHTKFVRKTLRVSLMSLLQHTSDIKIRVEASPIEWTKVREYE